MPAARGPGEKLAGSGASESRAKGGLGRIMSGTDHRVPEAPRERPPGLWRHRDFLLLWSGQAVSELGSAVTLLAVPLIAVVLLHASTFSVGLLATASTLPFLIIALPAGLVVDRLAKRPMLIACDASRLVVIGSVPVAAAAGVLTMAQLFVVALVAGILTVFFDVAYQSYLPALIRADQLADGNGKLSVTQSFAQVAGPGLGGALFGLLRAGALTVDAISYGVSTLSLLLIRTREPAIERPAGDGGERPKLRTEIFAGLNFVVRHPVLRKIAACTGTANFFGSIVFALEIIFLIRVLHVRPAYTGLIVAAGSIGGIVAGFCPARWPGGSARPGSSGSRCSASAHWPCCCRWPSRAGGSRSTRWACWDSASPRCCTTSRRSATGRRSARRSCSAG